MQITSFVVAPRTNRTSNLKQQFKLKRLFILLPFMMAHYCTFCLTFVVNDSLSSSWKEKTSQLNNDTNDPLFGLHSNHSISIADEQHQNQDRNSRQKENNTNSIEQLQFDDKLEKDDEEGDDEEDGDDEDDDEEEFYNKNPVGSLKFNLNDIEEPQTRGTNASGSHFDDFDDFEALDLSSFYGQQGDNSSEKLKRKGKEKKRKKKRPGEEAKEAEGKGRKKKKKRKRKKISNSDSENNNAEKEAKKATVGSKASASDQIEQTNNRQGAAAAAASEDFANSLGGSAECALSTTSSGFCLTYAMVEWALARARRLLGAQVQPDRTSTATRPPTESVTNSIGELVELTTRLLAFRFHLNSDEVSEALEQVDIRRTTLWRQCPRFYRAAAVLANPQSAGGQFICSLGSTSLDVSASFNGRFRTHSGLCNNPVNAYLGASHMPFVRMLEPHYADSIGLPRGGPSLISSSSAALASSRLPPARLVSLKIHSRVSMISQQPVESTTATAMLDDELSAASPDFSALFANWGQLINHDLASASPGRESTGHRGSCCSLWADGQLSVANQLGLAGTGSTPLSRICMPIELAPGDPLASVNTARRQRLNSNGCLEFKRSIAALRPGCSLGPRSQMNLVTSFVDASFVYGSSQAESTALRQNAAGPGQLATWNYFRRQRLKPLLPPQVASPNEDCINRPLGLYCFRSGDSRTNQHLPLVLLHTLHTRQHNRLAQALALINPHWTSERIYHEARHIHIAQVQLILIQEYLPLLLNERTLLKFDLTLRGQTLSTNDENNEQAANLDQLYWDHYDPQVNAGVSPEFAAAAFRQGHSSVAGLVFRLPIPSLINAGVINGVNQQQQQQDEMTTTTTTTTATQRPRVYPLRQLFRQPWPLFEPYALDEFTLGLLETPAQQLDQFVSPELQHHLLPDSATGGSARTFGQDLVAINVQRGRDQGVADYNSFREWCQLGRLSSFEQLTNVMSAQSAQMLAELYASVNEIDLFTGGLSEFPLDGAQVGPTFACIIGRQFQALRAGDRFWFESSLGPHAFSPAQLSSIKQFTLARLICANSDRFERFPQSETIQVFALRLPHPVMNPRVSCSQLPDIDLAAWLESAGVNVGQPTPVVAEQEEEQQEEQQEEED